ncbi:MAG: RdgB/HAM1 family non-canonical purine NTP pyrophosphatase [Gemmatimonadaceae bacterium]
MRAELSRVLLATRSAGKLRELNPIFSQAGIEAVTLEDVGIPEDEAEAGIECFETFEENALAKARYFHALTGLPVVADDSGLCVTSLGDAPGVWSKRYSREPGLDGVALDRANNEKLLRELAAFSDKTAKYRCAAAYVDKDRELVKMGETAGEIVVEPRGEAGFGYDPYFYSTELAGTFGEASVSDKQQVSHRGRAFGRLIHAVLAGGGA